MKKAHIALLIAAFMVGSGIFFALSLQHPRLTGSFQTDCSDVATIVEPCTVHQAEYGLPFTFSVGHRQIPGISYSLGDINWFLAGLDLVIIVGLPLGLVGLWLSERKTPRP
jgi:hypothetical protein